MTTTQGEAALFDNQHAGIAEDNQGTVCPEQMLSQTSEIQR